MLISLIIVAMIAGIFGQITLHLFGFETTVIVFLTVIACLIGAVIQIMGGVI